MNTLTLILALILLAGPARADQEEQMCRAGLLAARRDAASLPAGDLSRRFAENALDTAETELLAGEVEDCADAIAQARWIVRTRPYVLRPGETLGVSGPTP